MSDRLSEAELEHLREVLQAAAPMKSDHAVRIPIADYLRIVNPKVVLWLIAENERLRAALQALVDATDARWLDLQDIATKRAAAVELLQAGDQ